jgi:hypothetical protein
VDIRKIGAELEVNLRGVFRSIARRMVGMVGRLFSPGAIW